ncbi:multiple epidermal growth factor-like domains protein 10 isoform X6 [Haliotis rubra]|uniref:multiple epidermal growth factor-like domains protein 10 isoform X6 n=1 Tax=Haliotis rubra TaxID=36100 RepID=UPI001EE5935F|nr:multiple epidermal growth factor-like domains protein 10 isoform X6 [Haliotis rubra]
MEKYLGAAVLFVIFLGHCSCNCPGGTYGYNCGYTCNCDQDKCNPTSGCSPPNCSPGWSGPTCQKHNLARVKPTSSSGEGLYPSSQATDGNTAANSYAFCIETKGSNPNWWRVDLNDTVLIRDVTIYFRTDYTPRRNGIQVYLTNTTTIPSGLLCYTVTGRVDGPDINNTTSFPCHGRGRYVLLYTTTANNRDTQPIMDFCEVEVNACDPGTFGADCENYCHCKDGVCNDITGVCPPGGCLAGWKGTNCDVACVQGVEYGVRCLKTCSTRMCQGDGSTCSRDTGRCDGGCQAGWEGEDCTSECQSRTFGVNCSSTCGHCVDDEPCHHVTRTCLKGCSPGWVSDTCQQECQSRTFGVNCSSTCGHCVDDEPCHPCHWNLSQGLQSRLGQQHLSTSGQQFTWKLNGTNISFGSWIYWSRCDVGVVGCCCRCSVLMEERRLQDGKDVIKRTWHPADKPGPTCRSLNI